MHSRSLINAITTITKSGYTKTRRRRSNLTHILQWRPQRAYATGPQSPPRSQDVAVIGGGITGLAAAYFISGIPNTTVTLYEGGKQLGGWLSTKSVFVGTGRVVFEQGPRALRPSGLNGMVTRHLIQCLGLTSEIVATPKSSVGARNRYIYYPDHLVRMPSGLGDIPKLAQQLFEEPVFAGVLPGLLGEYFRPPRALEVVDESVRSFVARRFNPHVADNIVSAIVHGIYAGDVDKLSILSLASYSWSMERMAGSLTKDWMKSSAKHQLISTEDVGLMRSLRSIPAHGIAQISNVSQYSFKRGIRSLVEALERGLANAKNVTVKTGTKVNNLTFDRIAERVTVRDTNNQPPKSYNRVVCTTSGPTLSKLTNIDLSSLAAIHSVSVMVVNLYYTNPDILPVHGFGYLIPKSISFEQNPESALGVVFDSDAVTGQDTATGTKVTVMMGGHYWDGWSAYPDEEEAARMAKAVLARHLNIHDEPKVVNASFQKDCIPQYTVGHQERMQDAHRALVNGFRGHLCVAGNSYTGVGVNDCIRAAFDVFVSLNPGFDNTATVITGLQRFLTSSWTQVPKEYVTF